MTSSDPLRATNSILNVGTSSGVFKAWESMQVSPIFMKPLLFDIKAMMPDYNKVMSPFVNDIAKTLATSAAVAYPTDQLAGIQKMIVEASGVNNVAKMFMDSHNEMMRGLYPSPNFIGNLGLNEQFQSPIATLTKSLASSMDTSYLNSILATAATYRDQLGEQELDELADEFFENHPDLSESLQESPALYALSRTDRRVVVWFVGIIVTLYVGSALLTVGTEYPELKALVDAFGLDAGGGLPAGLAAAKATDMALEKLSSPVSRDSKCSLLFSYR
jgi:hypothetical protein